MILLVLLYLAECFLFVPYLVKLYTLELNLIPQILNPIKWSHKSLIRRQTYHWLDLRLLSSWWSSTSCSCSWFGSVSTLAMPPVFLLLIKDEMLIVCLPSSVSGYLFFSASYFFFHSFFQYRAFLFLSSCYFFSSYSWSIIGYTTFVSCSTVRVSWSFCCSYFLIISSLE